MRHIATCLLAGVLLMAPISAAFAKAPLTSLRPVSRPSDAPGKRLSLVPVYYTATLRPVARPVEIGGAPPLKVAAIPAAQTPVKLVTSRSAVARSLRPLSRPAGIAIARVPKASKPATVRKTAAVAVPKTTGKQGKICGNKKIIGQKLTAIPAKLKGCGLRKPVRVTSVAGIPLSKGATMDCDTAKALNTWVEKGAKPAVGRLGGGIARIDVISGYSCRTRNSLPGAKISEHGKGKAVDLSGVTLKNGVVISVLKGWKTKAQGKILRAMHKSACGPFGTVLGPDANKYHRDHFHFDTARYRNGTYCK